MDLKQLEKCLLTFNSSDALRVERALYDSQIKIWQKEQKEKNDHLFTTGASIWKREKKEREIKREGMIDTYFEKYEVEYNNFIWQENYLNFKKIYFKWLVRKTKLTRRPEDAKSDKEKFKKVLLKKQEDLQKYKSDFEKGLKLFCEIKKIRFISFEDYKNNKIIFF